MKKAFPDWLATWWKSCETGTSSKTIAAVLSGHADVLQYVMRFDAPHDTSDVGRCVRLLDLAPKGWRKRLGRVAEVCPTWAPLVERWPEIEAAYREDVKAQNAWTAKNGGYHWPKGKSQRALKQQAIMRTFPPSRCWWLVSTLRGHGDPYKDRDPHPFNGGT